MNIRIFLSTWFLFFGCFTAHGQVPTPGEAQEKPIVLLGATAHLGNGRIIEKAALAFEEGILTAVVAEKDFTDDLERYVQYRLTGKHIYPGFILPATDLGLIEIGAVKATVDNREVGRFNPNIRSLIAYNTDSELTPTMRFNGILLAQIAPRGGVISGTSSVVQLDAWNWEDAAVKTDDALHLHWPGRFRNKYDKKTFTIRRVKNKDYDKAYAAIEKLFEDAKVYEMRADKTVKNLKLEAMLGLFSGKKALYIYTGAARSIMESVSFAQKQGVQKIVLVGAQQAHQVTDFLKEHNIPVILADVHRLPSRPQDAYDLPYRLAGILHKAGVDVALSYHDVSNARNLPFYAGTVVAHAQIRKEEALKLITANPAKILGIDKSFGTLEKGKSATLFVSAGDALDMLGNHLEMAFIDGRKLTLPAMQQRLYEKFKQKYKKTE